MAPRTARSSARTSSARSRRRSRKLDGDYDEARELFEQVALGDEFVEFLTLPAYERID